MRVTLANLRPEPIVRRWTTFWICAAIFTLTCTLISGAVVARRARADLAHTARASAALHAAVLRSELAKHRSLPFVLAQDPDVVAVLAAPTPGRLEALNRKLETLTHGTGAAVIYLLNVDGLTVAASNWREPTSFVGVDYSFRSYYREAKADGRAEMFALGTSSRRPGLYMSQRVDGRGDAIGIVVVKAEFQQLEADWSADVPAFAADADGIILVTSIPQWRFHTLTALPPNEQARLHAEQRFGAAPFRVLPTSPHLRRDDEQMLTSVALPGGSPQRFMAASTRLAGGLERVRALAHGGDRERRGQRRLGGDPAGLRHDRGPLGLHPALADAGLGPRRPPGRPPAPSWSCASRNGPRNCGAPTGG
ncbi:hypothetical protein [Phenylobacterium sp. J367]|uniref:cache domain-containing protein n=1 Tax=Phenylobacterium sp. J367 TaxID=2898435 RepID=UPI00215125CE|nr:hypothetical protein [Phenylobacterium sp. J367]MCR5881109.1 hypothetical protein [Phenylobacterium sp. J367]